MNIFRKFWFSPICSESNNATNNTDRDAIVRILVFSSLVLITYIGNWCEKNLSRDVWYFSFFIFTCGIFFLIVCSVRESDFVNDMKDITLIELITQTLFLIFYVLPDSAYQLVEHLDFSAYYRPINCAFITLYGGRVFWMVKTLKRDAFRPWPVIGIFSYLYKRKHARKFSEISWLDVIAVYGFIGLSYWLTGEMLNFSQRLTHKEIKIQELALSVLALFVIVKYAIPAVYKLFQAMFDAQAALHEEVSKNQGLIGELGELRNRIQQLKNPNVSDENDLKKDELLNTFDALHPDEQSAVMRMLKGMLKKIF